MGILPREWFNWKDFHFLLVVLDKAQSSNLAFRMSVTRKWGIPKAHYMPIRACASFGISDTLSTSKHGVNLFAPKCSLNKYDREIDR